MTSKRKHPVAKPGKVEYPRKTVLCMAGETGEEKGRNYAALITSSELSTVRIIKEAEKKSGLAAHIDVPTLMEQLRTQAVAVNRNDLSQAEAMLMNQATALQSLFAHLAEKALSGEHLPQFETFMRMALRAQNQCRATLETLAAIKNPPVIYARQTNIAHGNQQVNNGTAEPVTHAGNVEGGDRGDHRRLFANAKTENRQNELLKKGMHGQTVDTGRTGTAIGINAAVATMEEVNRSEDCRG